MSETITSRISDIITSRNRRVSNIERVIRNLQTLRDKLMEFEYMKAKIVPDDGGQIDSSYKAIIDRNPEMLENIKNITTEELKSHIAVLYPQFENLKRRFVRKELHISVVGKARQGKSKLLQSISGLNDTIIPASDGTDCTGAKSIIRNEEGGQCVRIVFFSEEEMLSIIQKYMLSLYGDKRIDSLKNIRNLNIKVLESQLPRGMGADAKFEHLVKYLKNYDEYSKYLGKEITLTDEREIRKYVAQYGENKNIKYYNYLAVKEANISCQFPFRDSGRIVLIDTIGLGDTSLGLRERMLETIANDSDAVVLLRRPDPLGDSVNEVDTELYDLIARNFEGKSMDKWLFWVFNKVETAKGYNVEMCGNFYEMLKRKKMSLVDTLIVDCCSQQDVEENLLKPLLNHLADNLDSIDGELLAQVNRQIEALYYKYHQFVLKVDKVLFSDSALNSTGLFFNLFENSLTELQGAIKRLCMEYKMTRDKPCTVLEDKIRFVLNTVNKLLPSTDMVNESLMRGAATAPTVYIDYANEVRTNLTAEFIAIDMSLKELVKDFKDRVTRIIIEKGQFHFLKQQEDIDCELLSVFYNQLLNDQTTPQLRIAFKFLYDFDVSVRGFMMHKVRKNLDKLDPDTDDGNIGSFGDGEDRAKHLVFKLRTRLSEVREVLDRELRNCYRDPNEAFFAAIKEFYERISFAKGVKSEWMAVYLNNQYSIWKDKFDALKGIKIAFEEWESMVRELSKIDNKKLLIL